MLSKSDKRYGVEKVTQKNEILRGAYERETFFTLLASQADRSMVATHKREQAEYVASDCLLSTT